MNWPKGPYRWIEGRTLFISIPFTWNLPSVRTQITQGDYTYDRIVAGGPAVQLIPNYLSDIAEIGHELPGVLQRVNRQATRSTVGCPNQCKFCGVGQRLIEGEGFRELNDWPDLPIYCDNNLLAASKKHFNRVIDRLKHHPFADFNQGLDARFLKKHHAKRLAELHKPIIRLAWDTVGQEKVVRRAIGYLLSAGIPKSKIRCYVLIGFQDIPGEALYRLEELTKLGITTNPMRYTPLNALDRSEYVNAEKGWTEDLLKDYMKYWSNRRFFKNLPFEDFDRLKKGKRAGNREQKGFGFEKIGNSDRRRQK